VDLAAFLLAGGRVPETPAPSQVLTLKELAERYRQAHANGAREKNGLATARMHLRHFIGFLGERVVVQQLSAQTLQGYVDKRSRRKGAKD
jgi:hypothetical protein